MDTVEEIVDQTLAAGVLTQEEHDRLMKLIHQDGKVDESESAQLSRLLSAIEEGRLRVVDALPSEHAPKKNTPLPDRQQTADFAAAQQKLQAEERLSSIRKVVQQALSSGVMLAADYERIMNLVQADGKIDEDEKKILSGLFEAIQCGRLKLVEQQAAAGFADDLARSRIEEAKRRAIERDEAQEAERQLRREQPPEDPEDAVESPNASEPPSPPPPPFEQQVEQPPASSGSGDPGPSTFMSRARGRRDDGRAFALENDRLLDIRLNGRVWIRTGSMVAYYGLIKFTREWYTEHGITKLIKKAITGEGTPLTKAAGQGNLYLADQGKKISIIELLGQSLVVNGRNILAFEETINWDITYLRQFAAMFAGGFFNVRLNGRGMLAITSHFDPLVLRVTPLDPVMTDANATVAWSGSLSPQFKTDISADTLIGRTSGETLQMRFEGDGFVVIQPYEDSGPAQRQSGGAKESQ